MLQRHIKEITQTKIKQNKKKKEENGLVKVKDIMTDLKNLGRTFFFITITQLTTSNRGVINSF